MQSNIRPSAQGLHMEDGSPEISLMLESPRLLVFWLHVAHGRSCKRAAGTCAIGMH